MTSFGFAVLAVVLGVPAEIPSTGAVVDAPIYQFQCPLLEGGDQDFSEFAGEVVMVVNVASFCGLTPQYAGLQSLYESYSDQGFRILGFPCNDFGKQEPGTPLEIRQFCSEKYDVSFPLFAKVKVSGDETAPIYRYLTAESPFAGPVTWNFQKYLFGRDGRLVARFDPRTTPDDEALTGLIEEELAREPQDLVLPDPNQGAVALQLHKALKRARAEHKQVMIIFAEQGGDNLAELNGLLSGAMAEVIKSGFVRLDLDPSDDAATEWLQYYAGDSDREAPFIVWLSSEGFVTARAVNADGENISLPFSPDDAEDWLALLAKQLPAEHELDWAAAKEAFLSAGGF